MMQCNSRIPSCTTFVLALIVSMIVFFFLLLPITQSKFWLLNTKRNGSWLLNTQRNGAKSSSSPDYSSLDEKKPQSTRMPMGEKEGCDDGKRNLEMDLGDMEEAITCYTGGKKYGSPHIKNDKPVVLWKKPDESKEVCRMPSAEYSPQHKCMGTKIDYSETTWGSPVPTHGPHRPVWASFGMYRYLPPERWQHNLEHGVVVLLYHPCLNVDRRGKQQLVRLIHTVRGCIRKHVVTPSRRWTTINNPLTLVAWGCSLSLSSLSLSKVRNFIKSYGLQAPEGNYTKDGEYNLFQIYKAGIPHGSTVEDSVLCPEGY